MELNNLDGHRRKAILAINEDRIRKLKAKLRMKYIKKIKWIFHKQLGKSCSSKPSLKDLVVAMDDISVPSFTERLIQKGPKCSLRSGNHLINSIPQLESCLIGVEDTAAESVRWDIAKCFKNKQRLSKEERSDQVAVKLTKQWMQEEASLAHGTINPTEWYF